MKIKIGCLSVLVFLCALFVHSVYSEERSIEQSKAQILEDIEMLEHGLFKIKECISAATTAAELERCREEVKIRKFQEVQDKLFEIGMSREERRIKRFPRE